MPEIEVATYGIRDIEAAIREMGPGFEARLLGPALGRMAAIIRQTAKTRGYGFKDRRRRLGYPDELADEPPGVDGGATRRYRDLRQSIRSPRIPARYGGRRYKTGRAAVFAGGPGARQAHLVEEGHGGPRAAPPYSFLREAALKTRSAQSTEFMARVRRDFPRLIRRVMRSRLTYSAQHSYARTVARRARSRRR